MGRGKDSASFRGLGEVPLRKLVDWLVIFQPCMHRRAGIRRLDEER
jgi:hypothetical protein